jgi:CsoR family transcriptional regulator, copper-sensing transcriptional repressor
MQWFTPITRTSAMRGYSTSRDDLLNRLARVEGQVRGISRMVEDDRYCIDVVTQINAARAALDKIALGLLDDHVRHCLVAGSQPEQADELMAAVGRLVSR